MSGPPPLDHVAPPSVLRKTPAALPAQMIAGSDGATTTAFTAPPVGPEELQPASRERMRTATGACMCRWYDPSAVSVVFFTGYPGFLGSELLPRILKRRSDAVAHCLVQPKFAALARERAAAFGERVRIIEGDITSRINAEP